MIPVRTVAMGREAVLLLGPNDGRNFDLSSDAAVGGFQDGWPVERLNSLTRLRRWLHSDAREIAYRYNHRLFEKWVEIGILSAP